MEILDRVVIIVFTIILFLISIIMILSSLALIPQEYIINFISQNYGRLEVAVIGLVLMLISLRIITPLFKRRGEENTIVQESELGQISISLKAIDNLVSEVISQAEGIEALDSKLRADQEGLHVFLKISVNPDLDIPELTANLQTEIKEYLNRTTGVVVAEIKVLVKNIAQESNLRAG